MVDRTTELRCIPKKITENIKVKIHVGKANDLRNDHDEETEIV